MAGLQKHFEMDYTKILPNPNSVILGPNYRITILSERLVRLEYSETGSFEDRPTEFAMNRNFPPVQFNKNDDGKYIIITTKYFYLTYMKGTPFLGPKVSPDQHLRIDLNDTDKYWYYGHPEARNFKGTSFSLDGNASSHKLSKGLYSTDGFVSFDDSNSLIFNADGTMGKRTDKRYDIYVFFYKRDFGAALRDYFTLTGFPPLIPRYALGVWWNKNVDYDTKGVENLVYKFYKNKVPMSVLLLGDKWHRKNDKKKSGLTFNQDLFKRPKRLMDFLHSKGIRVGVSVNPFEGISDKEDYYLPYKAASGLTQIGDLPFNVFNPNIISSYFDYLIHPLMNYGVDFFWITYNNPNDLVSLRALTHYHFNDFRQIANRRGLVLARNGLLASHRYPIHYTGETFVSWANLQHMAEFNSTASNIGISWISNDIGGYTDGIEDGELYARFVQFGCFSPILRLTADESRYYKREPWRWDISTNAVVSKYLRMRHSLIPYLYSEAYRYSRTGLPLVQPLYYRYPEIYDEPLYKGEYSLGSSLLVVPITTKMDKVMERTIQKMYLPEGIWYDITTGRKFVGGKRYTAFYNKESYPVFAKAGTVLPLAILDENNLNDTTPPKAMEIQIFPGESNTYQLYEDDGISSLHEEGFFIVTDIDFTYQKNNFTVVIRPVAGKSGIIPDYRTYRIRFRNTNEPETIDIHDGAERVKGVETYLDDNDLIIELPALSTLKQITIVVKGKNLEIDVLRLFNDDVTSILNDLPIPTKNKDIIAKLLFNDDDDIKAKRIKVRKLKKYGVSQKHINLFLKLLEYLQEF